MLKFKNLKQVITTFSDEKVCRDFLVQQRWNGSPVCPYCGSNKWYSIEDGKRFKCGNKECYKKYSVTVGTIFHASNIPLSTWLPAMYLNTAHKKGISSCQLAKDLGVCQKTAWFMLHRIRESLKDKNSPLLNNTVEIDEMFIGARGKNLSNKKRKELREKIPTGNYLNKTMVVGMIERGGNLKLKVAGEITTNRIFTLSY
jgi:transposase-like protein